MRKISLHKRISYRINIANTVILKTKAIIKKINKFLHNIKAVKSFLLTLPKPKRYKRRKTLSVEEKHNQYELEHFRQKKFNQEDQVKDKQKFNKNKININKIICKKIK